MNTTILARDGRHLLLGDADGRISVVIIHPEQPIDDVLKRCQVPRAARGAKAVRHELEYRFTASDDPRLSFLHATWVPEIVQKVTSGELTVRTVFLRHAREWVVLEPDGLAAIERNYNEGARHAEIVTAAKAEAA